MASKQITYCSLEEAWGEKYANVYKKDDSMLTAMPKQTDDNPVILNDRSLTTVSTPIDNLKEDYMNAKKDIVEKRSCEGVLDHILECQECRDKINKILGGTDNRMMVESFGNMNDNIMDVIILILLGIFIIFILDCFVRLGKNFKK